MRLRKFPLLMESRYSGAAGITADRVADKSFNNAKIRRAWMYNCGIFVDEPISLFLSLPLSSPSSSFFSPIPFPLCRGCTACRLCSSDAVTHRFSILAKCPRTVIFLRWLVAPHSPPPLPFRFEEGDIVLNLDLASIPASKHYRFHSPRFESTDNRRRPPRI